MRNVGSDSISRWTPLLLANGWSLSTPIADLHRLANRHARRTKKALAFARVLNYYLLEKSCNNFCVRFFPYTILKISSKFPFSQISRLFLQISNDKVKICSRADK